jgi:hypothetical protein
MSDNEVATVAPSTNISGLNAGDGFFSSLSLKTQAERVAMLKAVNGSQPLADNLNTPIPVKDIVCQQVQIENEATGVINDAIRTTLIDGDGNAYHATSKGIFTQVKNMINILGNPNTWDEPVTVTATKEGTGARKFLTLSY